MANGKALLLLILLLAVCGGLSVGLTFLPCYSSLCSEDFFPIATRIHIAGFYGILASIGAGLLLRATSPSFRSASQTHLSQRELPVLGKRISFGGLLLAIWIVGLAVATIGFWLDSELNFWAIRTVPLQWADAQIRLAVTGIIGHQADILLGLVVLPVGRNSILGRTFDLHQSTLLYAHKLVAYLLLAIVFAHGAATYTFVATYAAAKDDSARKSAFSVDNPTLTLAKVEGSGAYHNATLATGMFSFIFIVVIVITALPYLRRRSYNTFYYVHIILSSLTFIAASSHASTDFYFLLPGLVLWLSDWVWRLYRGDSGLRRTVDGILEDAGQGWYRIRLPIAVKSEASVEGQLVQHPLQSYYITIPSISKLQNHAFTAARIGSNLSGPTILLRKVDVRKNATQGRMEKEWTWKVGRATVEDLEPNNQDLDQNLSTHLPMRVEGPYSPRENTGFETANHLICLVGGTGVTGALSLAAWWMQNRASRSDAMLSVIWTIRNAEVADVAEWVQLQEQSQQQAPQRSRLRVHVSSTRGRIDPVAVLREELAYAVNDEKDTKGIAGDKSAWLYVSGPSGLLQTTEAACLQLESEIRRSDSARQQGSLPVSCLDHYIAKWEV